MRRPAFASLTALALFATPVATVVLFAALVSIASAQPPPAASPSTASSASSAPASPLVHSIVATKSRATFGVTHLYIEHVSGSVPIVSGSASFAAADAAVPTVVEAILDPRRVDTANRDRDDDLQGPDWFDAARFPTWTFKSTSIAATAGGFTMFGTLSVHGVAAPVTLDVKTLHGFPHARYRATGKLDRHAFGMRLTPIDGVIGNDLDLTLEIELA